MSVVITDEDIKKLMDNYGDFVYKKDALEAEKKTIRDKIIPPEVQKELDDLEAEFSGKEKMLERQEKDARNILDNAVARFIESLNLKDKTTLRSRLMSLSITKGEVKWDADALDGFVLGGHPELLSFRKEESPKTRLTKNKI